MNEIIKLYGAADIYENASQIIDQCQHYAYSHVNVAMVARNWMLGKLIYTEQLNENGRAVYGGKVIEGLAGKLTEKYGKGFSYRDLYRCVSVYKAFPKILTTALSKSDDAEKLTTVLSISGQILSWNHYCVLARVTSEEAREWYRKEATEQMWSVRTLQRNISTQYYHRLLASQNMAVVESEMKEKTDAFENTKLEFIKNPVVAEFLGLSQNTDFTESELETSIITHLQKFLLEMGKGYAFVARQQHVHTDAGDYYIDLVFYNIYLKCYLLIDLKLGQITHQDIGQMDMYLRMYDDLKLTEGDNPTIGLLLCGETSEDMARYSVLHDNDRLFAAKYLTYLPSKEELGREIEVQKEIFRLQHEGLSEDDE